MLRRLLATGLLVTWLLSGSQAHAATITFQSQDVQLTSDSFTVDIVVEGLDQTVVGFLFNFTFDSTVLALQDVTEGSFLSQGQNGDTDFDASPISDDFRTVTNYLTTGSTSSTAGILASLTFVSLTAGDAGLTLLSILNDSFDLRSGFTTFKAGIPEEGIPDEYGFLEATLPPATIKVVAPPTSVPEPSTLGLLSIGLAALARKRLRRNPQRST